MTMPPDWTKNAREDLDDELQEGYSATRQESRELCRKFESADLENWDRN